MSYLVAAIAWLANNWKLAGSVILTALVVVNQIHPFVPPETMTMIIFAAGTIGLTVFKVQQDAIAAKADAAHDRISSLEADAPRLYPFNGPRRPGA